MTSLRVLVVGKSCPLTERLEGSGHHVTPVDECEIAVEALQLQSFDAVVLGEDVSPCDLEALAREVHALNSRSNARTAVLGIESQTKTGRIAPELDGYLSVQAGGDVLAEALAGATPAYSAVSEAGSLTALPVLNEHELKEQLDYDNDLLLELVGLYHSERQRQIPEMKQSLASGDLALLSRVAHTIKGSLGSLQAPDARAEAQLLESAAAKGDRSACERLLPSFERKLEILDVELARLSTSHG